MSEAGAPAGALLVLVDPVARRLDGESVRIAKDVLCAGAAAKVCLPESPEEFERALARRGHRRPVVVGDDRALVRAVSLLHRSRELAASVVSLIPVGPAGALVVARSLGVPTGAVAAARAVLGGVAQRHDLLVDDSDGVVLGGLRIPPLGSPPATPKAVGTPTVWSACRSLARTLVRPPVAGHGAATAYRLRVEADGVLLADVDQPVHDVSVAARDGLVEVVVRGGFSGPPRLARVRSVTVTGPDFRYRADHTISGPVRRRTWTLRAGAWGLTVPR
ncbi:diacylglycerol kinase [Streptomyces sp. WAC06614]|uniref:diacylglycerol kinase n=1 Tax=Streptomyces sp. WAC06614 TaxID=2487416 RepID=UPI000F79E39B|nr:diacylglycerol kinase [Streptomyces sp. WAC06614]RSS83842.1 diacylglycerol kinase [Streptomyces sp. WAC06614]